MHQKTIRFVRDHFHVFATYPADAVVSFPADVADRFVREGAAVAAGAGGAGDSVAVDPGQLPAEQAADPSAVDVVELLPVEDEPAEQR